MTGALFFKNAGLWKIISLGQPGYFSVKVSLFFFSSSVNIPPPKPETDAFPGTVLFDMATY